MNTFYLDLDLSKPMTNEPVRIRQGDKAGTTVVARIYDHGTLLSSSYSVRFVMQLPDKVHYYRETATFAAGIATVTIDETYAGSIAGTTDNAYFQIMSGSTVIASTGSFVIRVLADATSEAEVAEAYDNAIEEAIGNIPSMAQGATVEYLEAHPEITTTVQDNSITTAKLASGAVTAAKMDVTLAYTVTDGDLTISLT